MLIIILIRIPVMPFIHKTILRLFTPEPINGGNFKMPLYLKIVIKNRSHQMYEKMGRCQTRKKEQRGRCRSLSGHPSANRAKPQYLGEQIFVPLSSRSKEHWPQLKWSQNVAN